MAEDGLYFYTRLWMPKALVTNEKNKVFLTELSCFMKKQQQISAGWTNGEDERIKPVENRIEVLIIQLLHHFHQH